MIICGRVKSLLTNGPITLYLSSSYKIPVINATIESSSIKQKTPVVWIDSFSNCSTSPLDV